MFPVAVVTGLGWLFLFLGLLAAPPPTRSRSRGQSTAVRLSRQPSGMGSAGGGPIVVRDN